MTREGYAVMRHHFASEPRKRGRWYVEPRRVGAQVVEVGAGPDGAGLVCTVETVEDAHLIAASKDLLREAKETRDLCMLLSSVAFKGAVQDHLPYGTLERVKAWIQKHDGIDAAIRKAEGMGR